MFLYVLMYLRTNAHIYLCMYVCIQTYISAVYIHADAYIYMFLVYLRKQINVKRMHTAVRLNTVIKEKSSESNLIMINLPTPPKFLQNREHCIFFYILAYRVKRFFAKPLDILVLYCIHCSSLAR